MFRSCAQFCVAASSFTALNLDPAIVAPDLTIVENRSAASASSLPSASAAR